MKLFVLILGCTIMLIPKLGTAQLAKNDATFIALKQADSLVFEVGFNTCDLKVLDAIMHQDLEFLHDINGPQNRATFFEVFKTSICANTNGKPIRKLVDSSMVVYPLANEGKLYGAIQMGVHHFYIKAPNKPLRYTVSGKFIHTWLLLNGTWTLFRVVSYDHQETQ